MMGRAHEFDHNWVVSTEVVTVWTAKVAKVLSWMKVCGTCPVL